MPSGGNEGYNLVCFISSGSPAAYSDTSVSDTYERVTTSPAAWTSDWNRRRRQRSAPSAMKPRSALWPSRATDTTWTSSASARLTAWTTAWASQPRAPGPEPRWGTLQNRWSTPQPEDGASGRVTPSRGWVTPPIVGNERRAPHRAPFVTSYVRPV